MVAPLVIAKSDHPVQLLPKMANRHGIVAGATGTGKTVTIQVLAEKLSEIGVPVFVSDVKGDFSGISQPGQDNPKIAERVQTLGLTDYTHTAYPVTFWDVFGDQGHQLRATVSDMGPLLLSRLLDLNDTQTGVLHLVFKIADDNGLLLLDLKDLRSMLQFVGENAKQFTTGYGNISAASIGAIQRGLLTLESQGGAEFFGEPALDLDDLLQTDRDGRGVVNVLAADKLFQSPKVYATFLLWLLAELFEQLPEVGDLDKPKLVFFFDEAHLLFNDAPKALLEKIEQVVRLIRSKGVGVYFISQNPLDIPDMVAAQLGNRVQHALRAFTARDQKAVRAAAETFRINPNLDVEAAITDLGVGEVLISLLDEKGRPGVVERAFVLPPRGQIGPVTPPQRADILRRSPLRGRYEKAVDRESAYEMLQAKYEAAAQAAEEAARQKEEAERQEQMEKEAAKRQKEFDKVRREAERATAGSSRGSSRSKRAPASPIDTLAQTTMKQFGNTVGRELARGLLGSLLGGKRR